MTEDLRSRLGGLIDAEGSVAAPADGELGTYAREISSRRRNRAWASATIAVSVAAGVAVAAVAGLSAWSDRAAEPASSIERVIGFEPDVSGATFVGDGRVLTAPVAYREAAPEGQPAGCAALDEYGTLVRPADLWASTSDVTIRTGTLDTADGDGVARLTARWFADGGAATFVRDFAALATACAAGFDDIGPSGEGPGIDAVDVAAIDVGGEAAAVRATLELADGPRLAITLLGSGSAAIAVVADADAGPAVDRAVLGALRDFDARVLGTSQAGGNATAR